MIQIKKKNGIIKLEDSLKAIKEKIREKELSHLETKFIILDCSSMNYIDIQGVQAILQVISFFSDIF